MRILISELRRIVRSILIEGKIEDLQKKYPNVSVPAVAEIDPTPTKKYLEWLVKQADAGANSTELEEIIEKFQDKGSRLEKKDINSYKTIGDLRAALDKISDVSKRKEKEHIKTGGANVIYENDDVKVYYIKDRSACLLYGSNTKWCITEESPEHWDDYTNQGANFYFVIRKRPQRNKYDKVAIAVLNDSFEIYDALDNRLDDSFFADDENVLDAALGHSPKATLGKFVKEHGVTDVVEFLKDVKFTAKQRPGLKDGALRVIGTLDDAQLRQLVNANDYRVRDEVAKHIAPEHLPKMMKDKRWSVKVTVAHRIDASYLPQMMKDAYAIVRSAVTARIDEKYLPEMMDDIDYNVRDRVAMRIDASYLPQMMHDVDWRVRSSVAKRIDLKNAIEMSENDESPIVRADAEERVKELTQA
jgi:hypothetical protein